MCRIVVCIISIITLCDVILLLLYLTSRVDVAPEIYNVNYRGTRFDNATQIRISDARQCQTISAIVTITVLIIAFTITPLSTMVTTPNRWRYIVATSQYNDATTPILFSGSTTLSAITVEMNNAWKPGETLAEGKREPVKRARAERKKKRQRRRIVHERSKKKKRKRDK